MTASEERGAERKPAKDLRLPGSVAEILASPEGPKVGAFFDLDGTLVAGFTAAVVTSITMSVARLAPCILIDSEGVGSYR